MTKAEDTLLADSRDNRVFCTTVEHGKIAEDLQSEGHATELVRDLRQHDASAKETGSIVA